MSQIMTRIEGCYTLPVSICPLLIRHLLQSFQPFAKLMPGTKEPAHTTIKNGGHFLQENQGEKLAEVVVQFSANNP